MKSVAELENMYHSANGENFFVPASNAHDCHSKEVIFFLCRTSATVVLVLTEFYSDMQVLKSQVYVEKYLENNRHTFIDYISAGCQLNLMVAIDYTGVHRCAIASWPCSIPISLVCNSIPIFYRQCLCFIASNGNPRLPDSLHYIDPTGRPNAYQRVGN